MLRETLLRFNNVIALLTWMALDTLQGVISNAIKEFGFSHWTPINFQMRWSKVRFNTILA
jgi:hypothetical protein